MRKRTSIQQIKDAVPMRDLLEGLGWEFPSWESLGDWASVYCGLHDDVKHPSGRYTDTLEVGGNRVSKFWCPVCIISHDLSTGEALHSGDQFDLLIAAGLAKDFHQAAGWLSKTFGLGGYSEVEDEEPERVPPYPEGWGKPPWDQDRWVEMFTRWMPVARAAVSPKNGRTSLAQIFNLLPDLDELDWTLREAITYSILRFDMSRGGFTTLLQKVVRSRVRNRIRDEVRRLRRHGAPSDSVEPRDSRARTSRGGLRQLRSTIGSGVEYSSPLTPPEEEWARKIDWDLALEAASMELSEEHALYALLRGEGYGQRDISDRLVVSRTRVRVIEREFRRWYRHVRGHEATTIREARSGSVGGPRSTGG